jgi:hypothetical protein
MICNYEFKVGDIIVNHGNAWISKVIEFGMKLYSPNRYPYSHSAIVIENEGKLYVSEAQSVGIQTTLLEDTNYFKEKTLFTLVTPKIPYTENEKQIMSEEALKYSFKVTRYWFGNFLNWVGIIVPPLVRLNPQWFLHNNKRVYCSQFVAIITNKVRNYFQDPEKTNPNDTMMNGYYEIGYSNIK